jgi:putative glutamine amidotransferase
MSKPRPIIAVTAGKFSSTEKPLMFALKDEYVTAITRNGGIPLLIPTGMDIDTIPDLLARVDGVLLTGGSDLDPQLFGEGHNPKVYGIDPARDAFEIALVKHLVESGKPFLGICRGTQVMNVALGGTLYLDIADELPTAFKHDYFTPKYAPDKLSHPVSVEDGSLLAGLVGTGPFKVNSRHHQSIKDLAGSLKVTAYAEDGIIEGIELPSHPFALGVQWHPESLQSDPRMHALFAGLMASSARA